MYTLRGLFCTAILVSSFPCSSHAQSRKKVPPHTPQPSCPRGAAGSIVNEPLDLRSVNGVLKLDLAFRNSLDENGLMRYCYIYSDGSQAPNLRLYPGDTLILTIKNEVSLATLPDQHSKKHMAMSGVAHSRHSENDDTKDACSGGKMIPGSTNVHFHGMIVPPVCHQDETVKTQIRPSSPPFEYRIQIPKNEPPGLYWYHPHPHGFSEEQVLGGASGALIVEGIERVNRDVVGLPERILIIRDQDVPNAPAAAGVTANRPTKDLSINFVPVLYPKYTTAMISMKPSARELWRVLNASADTYLDLALQFAGKPQSLGVVALDGVPFGFDDGNTQDRVISKTHIPLPPAGRAEFIVTAPPEGI